MCVYNVLKGSQSEAKPLLTDFLDLGLDREEALMLDLFLKNILNVAESKFSTAKHLQDVWRAMKMDMSWVDSTHLMLARKAGVNNNAGAPTDCAAIRLVEYKIPE